MKVKKFLKYGIPLGIIVAYRCIPAKVRGKWSAGTSSSHLALKEPSWLALFRYGAPRIGLDTYRTGWPEGTPGSGLKGGNGWGRPAEYPRPKKLGLNTYKNGWPNGATTGMTTVKAFSLFLLAWLKLFLLLPLIILGVSFEGWPGDDD